METKEHKTLILKENSEGIRRKIQDAGINICVCAKFKDNCWLDYHTRLANLTVHGIGCYGGELEPQTQQEALDWFMHEATNPVICKDVDEFIKMIKEG